jgi:hypothetical protein
VKQYNHLNALLVWERDHMVDCANPRSYALDALRKEAEEQRRQLRQLNGRCVECGGLIELVVGAGFVMTTGCSVCQVCHRRKPSGT